MKFEDYLMQQKDDKQKRLDLEKEVENLRLEFEEEQMINKVLYCALHGPVSSQPCLASLLPPQVQGLLAELAMVEEEIIWLERKVDELKLNLYQERNQTQKWKLQRKQQRKLRHQNHLPPCRPGNSSVLDDDSGHLSRSKHYKEFRKENMKFRRASLGSAEEMSYVLSTGSTSDEKSRRGRMQKEHHMYKEICDEKPNELSEELIKCLIGIFLALKQAPKDREESAIIPKLGLSYLDSTIRDIGPYKNFIHIARNSLDIGHFAECLPQTGKLRVLIHKLGNVELTFLTYKQKLAFWINIYNASIMHAFLEHGLPSSQEKLLAIMNKAALNVGGIVLNALAIEHFILRHPCESKHGPSDEKEMLLRHAYGLGYPESNVTFALCRGTWSSPALRVYTPEEVTNELEKAKVEYLEASVGVTSKRKIVIPKLLQWHMQDFADSMESLLEWIYSQLPRSGSLKRLMLECINGETKYPSTKMAEIQPYESEFRYLLPL
ncbi:uncharacterized protein LOC110644125 isoform X2 [Hevea brasiliensis]|uniref:uncharacterized protein LOC110644125 isoform X2 n=1 Tax=Hevea brasiliensis TaxID=3981 RepID=UPI0025F67DF6|nr:uncharacterized protein LOC110644125 isoform X2 [Hevea brasiliensis]